MKPSISTRTRIAALLLFAAVAIAPSAMVVDRALGRDVLLISPHDEATVRLNRGLHHAGDPVAGIYGDPLSKTVRIVRLTERGLIRPAEDRSLLLLPAGGNAGWPLRVQTVLSVARYTILALLLLSLLIAFLPIPRMLFCAGCQDYAEEIQDVRGSPRRAHT